MELLRVFNKKRLCIFGLMIILNAVLFIMGNKISEQEIIYRDLVNSYNDNISITEMSKNYLQENPQVSDEDFKEARKIFLERLDYVKNYKERTQNSIDKIKDVQKSSLFSQKNSRSYLELIKSKNDLTKALGYEVKLDNDLWLMKIKDYKYIYWFTGIGCLVVILLIMLVSIGWYYFCYDKVDKLTATGTIEVTKYDVTPRLAGYIRNLKLEEGDNLNLGDFVCEIEREDLRAQNIGDWQAVKEAQAKLQDLKDGARKQEITMAENSLQKAQVIFDKAQTDLKRNKELYAVGGISKQTLDDMQKAVDVAEKELYIAKENYDLVLAGTRQKQIEAQQQQVEKLIAQANANASILADTKVYSPITGVILNKNFENNEYINQGQAILTIADLTDSWVIVYIDIADLGKVYLQQKVKIQVDAYPQEVFQGQVININDEAEFTPRETLTKDERSNKVFAVKIKIFNEHNRLKAGMIADVIFDD